MHRTCAGHLFYMYYTCFSAFECSIHVLMLLPIILSEVSQKEKDTYCISTHIYGIEKDSNNDHICKATKETQV